MAAGLGFKTFAVGEILSAANVNGYLMQGVLVFADAAARSAAITSPQEGQTSYLKDTDVIQVYSGSAWVTKSGGSSPLTTKGDLYTYSTTDARLPVGTNGYTLVADSAEATGLKWAAPAGGGGKVLQVVQATYSTVTSSSSSTFADTGLTASITPSSATSKVLVMVSQNGCSKNNTSTNQQMRINLLRGATQIIDDFAGGATYTGSSLFLYVGSCSVEYLDSPNTTSSTTYKTQFKTAGNASGVSVQSDSCTSTITLLEIGA
jgi:hypothetical protein